MAHRTPSNTGIGEPVLFDFQVNGFAGIDFQRDDLGLRELRVASAGLRAHGTGRIFVTLITDDVDRLCRRLENLERLRALDAELASLVAGYHLEGPWLNPEPGYSGAHPPEAMHAPSIAEFDRLQSAARGGVRLVTLAPEWPGSAEVVAHIRACGAEVSIGHSNASDLQIDEAIRAGARFCTHLGNGVPQLLPRHDNVIQRLLSRDELVACFIPDGLHLPPRVLRNFVRCKPEGRVLFTTDAMAGAGAAPGRYSLGSMEVVVGRDRVALNGRGGGFAGSTLAPDEGVANVAALLGFSPERALSLWSEVPERLFGLGREKRDLP